MKQLIAFLCVLLMTSMALAQSSPSQVDETAVESTATSTGYRQAELDADAIAQKHAQLFGGYIPFPMDEARLAFQKEFPAQTPTDRNLRDIQGYFYNLRLMRVLALATDLDARTLGKASVPGGAPVSISGYFSTTTLAALASSQSSASQRNTPTISNAVGDNNQRIQETIVQNIALPQASPVPNASVGVNVAGALLGGLIVGFMQKADAERSIANITRVQSFGERMTDLFLRTGDMSVAAIDQQGKQVDKGNVIPISNQVFRSHLIPYTVFATEQNACPIISTSYIYRGEKYQLKYPGTLGWEVITTNIIAVPSEPTKESTSTRCLKAIESAIQRGQIKLSDR